MKSHFQCDNEISFLFPQGLQLQLTLQVLYFTLPDDGAKAAKMCCNKY
jgi:hypothetical protein